MWSVLGMRLSAQFPSVPELSPRDEPLQITYMHRNGTFPGRPGGTTYRWVGVHGPTGLSAYMYYEP